MDQLLASACRTLAGDIGRSFIPIPIGSLLGTLETGGGEEFWNGITQTFSGNFRGTIGEPAPVEEFRVRNTQLTF